MAALPVVRTAADGCTSCTGDACCALSICHSHPSCIAPEGHTHPYPPHSRTTEQHGSERMHHGSALAYFGCIARTADHGRHVAMRAVESACAVTVVLLCVQVCIIRAAFITSSVSRTPLHTRAQSAGAHVAASSRWRCHAGCASPLRPDRFIPRPADGGDITISSAGKLCARITHNFVGS